jgi:cytidyltransferase-like protein
MRVCVCMCHCGCAGHIHIIHEAAKLGNVIVGILTDDAVLSYKGKSVVPYGHRVTIFQSLKGVTRVVPQTSLNYAINLDLLKPEFVVHGTYATIHLYDAMHTIQFGKCLICCIGLRGLDGMNQ